MTVVPAPHTAPLSDNTEGSVLLRAAWVAPMDAPPIRDAAVVLRAGSILDVGPAEALRQSHPAARVEDLGDVLLTPGLVNAHTHLELSELRAGTPPASFADWLISLMSSLFAASFDASDAPTRAALRGVAECLRFGVTSVADITSCPAATRPALRASPLRAVSFGEIRAMAGRRTLLQPQLDQAANRSIASDRFGVGISPHAPYSVEPDGYLRCLDRANRDGLPLTTHLAETRDEATFLRDHTGPFTRVWAHRGGWDEQVPTFAGGPIRFARSLGLLDVPTLLAHVNYCDDDELAVLAAGRASVAYCPRTHAYFGHPPHRWREMLARGINVCVGTDSRASSPDLNLLDDVRLLHRLAPEIPAATLWEMATTRAARAIGLGGLVGSITAGKAADFAAFAVSGVDPLTSVLERDVTPSGVWIDGARLSTA